MTGRTTWSFRTGVIVLAAFCSLAPVMAQRSAGVITGRVFWPDGRPVEGILVAAVAPSSDDDGPTLIASLAETDKAGRYRLEGIPPGDYKIAAGRLDWATYFPNARNATDGKSVKVTAGQTAANIDTKLVHPPASVEMPNPEAPEIDAATGLNRRITSLMRAITENASVQEIRARLGPKADVDARDIRGWTALMYAALLENTEVTQELLTRGADPRARSYSGQTAVMARILAAQTFSERLWEPQDAIPVLRLLLRAGADINAADDAGETPLMRAITGSISEGPERSYFGPPLGGLQTDDASPAALGRANLVAFLRDAGARPGLRNARGLTALDLLNEEARLRTAASGNQHEKLRMLLEQPGGSTRSVRVRGTVHPFTGVQRLTLRRIGIDPVSVSSDVGPEGAVDFPAVVPGVYVAEIVPPPSFPVAISPIAVPSADQANLRIALPVLQPVRIRVSFADEKQAGPFSLLLAQASPSDKPRQFHRVMSMPSAVGGPESLTIPEYMVAALSKGATVQLIILGEQTSPEAIRGFGPLARIPTLPFSRQIYLKRPAQLASQSEPDMFFYERRSQSVLTAAADGSFNMLLPEGSYVVAVGMSETSRAFGAKPDEILRSGAVDLTAAVFRVDASADREIVVSLPRNPSGGGNVDNGQ